MKTITLEYHGVIYSKKNSKRIVTNQRSGKPMIISSETAKAQEMAMTWAFRDQAVKQQWFFEEDAKDYEGRRFIVDVQIWQKDRTRRDLDNQLTAILDGLVSARALPDDSNKFIMHLGIDDMGIDKNDPRATIEIIEVENE